MRRIVTFHTISRHCLCVVAGFFFLFEVHGQYATGRLLTCSCFWKSITRFICRKHRCLVCIELYFSIEPLLGGLMSASPYDASTALSVSTRGPRFLGWLFVSSFVEISSKSWEVWYNPPEEVIPAQKWAKFRLDREMLDLWDSFYVVLCELKTTSPNNVIQIIDGLSE